VGISIALLAWQEATLFNGEIKKSDWQRAVNLANVFLYSFFFNVLFSVNCAIQELKVA